MTAHPFRFPKPRLALILALMWGLPLLYFAIVPIWQRSQIEIAGRVLQRTAQPYDPSNPARIYIVYLLEPLNGGSTYRYIATPSDTTTILYNQSPAVGALIQKDKWHLSYRINGQLIDDFPLGFQVTLGVIGLGLVGLGFVRILQGGIFVEAAEQRQRDDISASRSM